MKIYQPCVHRNHGRAARSPGLFRGPPALGRARVTMHCLNPDRVVMRGDVRRHVPARWQTCMKRLAEARAGTASRTKRFTLMPSAEPVNPLSMKCSPSGTACRPTCSEPRAKGSMRSSSPEESTGASHSRGFRRRQRAWRLGAHRGGRGASLTRSWQPPSSPSAGCRKSGRQEWSRKPPFENGVDGSYRRFHRRNLEAAGTGLLDRTDQLPGAQVIPEFL